MGREGVSWRRDFGWSDDLIVVFFRSGKEEVHREAAEAAKGRKAGTMGLERGRLAHGVEEEF
jgi:hypothetical protein